LWEGRDPLLRVRRLLDARGWADEAFHAALEDEAKALAETTRSACRKLEAPALEDTFRNTLVRETAALRAEREQYTTWRKSFV
jgi:pyruvate dehydrogenase E1 component alpha subunit